VEKTVGDFYHIRPGVYRRECKACHKVRTAAFKRENSIYCPGCRERKHRKHFQHGSVLGSLCGACDTGETTKFKKAVLEICYDYRFARTVVGMSHETTITWLAKGYCLSEWTLKRNLIEDTVPWEPDPYLGDIAVQTCNKCNVVREVTEFPLSKRKGYEPTRRKVCKYCWREYSYNRWAASRQTDQPIRTQRRRPKW